MTFTICRISAGICCIVTLDMCFMTSDIAGQAPVVSIIIISYNTKDMTLECLRTVVDQTTVPYELIVMDNASTDGSAEAIAAEFPDIQLMAETENHGFAGANNIVATHAKGEYLLLLNPDTLVLDGAIDKLVAFGQRTPEAGIWGGKTLWGDRTLNAGSCWGKLTLWNVFCRASGLTGVFSGSELFNSEAYGNWDRSTERDVDIVTGCFLLIKRDFWHALGGFDLSFIMYGEEADLCLRATQAGASPRVTPDAVIVHYGGASQKVRADKQIRVIKGKITLIDRHFPRWQRWIGRNLFALWPWSRAMVGRFRGAGGEQSVWAEIWRRRAEWIDGYPPLKD